MRISGLTWLLVLACLLAPGTSLLGALSPGWSDADINSPGMYGAASFTNGLWTLSGGGADICNFDQMHFAFKSETSDSRLVARVESVQNVPGAQAGIMYRNDLSAWGLEVSVLATAGSGVSFQWRNTVGVSCTYQVVTGAANLGVPIWLSLVRSGNNFSAYWSTNNSDWNQAGSTQTVLLDPTVLAGLVVSANNNSTFATATFSGVDLPAPAFGVYRQLWTGLDLAAGNTLAALTNTTFNPNWPASPDPDFTAIYTKLETETNTGMTAYGQRLRAFVVPPLTSSYTFWIASDGSSQLLLSPDERASDAVPVAWVNGSTNPREWTRETNQQSAAISLKAGCRYYLEALMQYGNTGTDNLAVRWSLPNGVYEEPIPASSANGTYLVPCSGLDSPPGICQQPTNITVPDGYPARFVVLVTNQAAVAYQWQVNGTNLSGPDAATAAYCLTNANALTDTNQSYCCIVSNSAGVVTSAVAQLTVLPDTTPPSVVRTFYLNSTNIQILFSEPLDPASATNSANYAFTNGTPVTGAQLGADLETVTLTTAPLVLASNYVIVLNGILDRSNEHNPIARSTTLNLVAAPYSVQGVGTPTPPGTLAGNGGGYDVGGGGRDIGGTSDQFQFVYETLVGDFDFQVRLGSLSPTDTFAKAGLMAREDLSPGSRFAAVLATPAMNGCFFQYRATAGGGAVSSGNLPANYPQTWLRLKRAGSQFTGYASFDGQTWQQLGTTALSFTNSIYYFGMAVCSHNTGKTAVAQFRDLVAVTNGVVALINIPREPLGPSSRKTPIAISEIMYKPAPRSDGNNLEFVEIYNSNPWFHDLSGYQLTADSLAYTFPPASILPGGAFLAIAASPQSIQTVYGITNVLGPYIGSLKKSGTLQLLDEQGAVLLSVPYSNLPPWPAGADGTGHSLALVRPSYGEGDPRAWDLSSVVGGSPGQMEAARPSPLLNVVINEFLARADPPDYDYIELYNHANTPVDISGCTLSDDPATNKFVIPSGTILPAQGFAAYTETSLNFRLSAAGQTLYLKNPDQSRYLDVVPFGAQENGVAVGRWPDGANDFYRLSAKTPGAPNAAPRPSDIVINELMHNPISGNDDDQYVELYNRSTNTISLAGWELSDVVSFTFPAGTVMGPGSYLVVARNAARLRANYPNLDTANCLGDFAGRLSHNSRRLALTMPDTLAATNSQGVLTTTPIQIAVNEVTYGTGGRWGQWAAGGGSSLELIDPNSNNRLAANWADSDESQKSVWTNIETTGVLDNGANYSGSIGYAQLGLLDVGECLVDSVEVISGASGPNLVINSDFEAGLGNWSVQGDHCRSSLENSGYSGSHCLHVRCSDRMWTGVNSCQATLSANTLAAGQTATLRFKARWLRGWPEVLLRLNGNWLEATGRMPVPANLGTPGARNSRSVAHAGPAIYEVTHVPSVPAAGQAAVVTALVHDPDGVQSLTLNYRLDPSSAYAAVPMRDDGTGGDAIAGDGVFSASIPGQAANTIAAFYISATDSTGSSTRFPALLNDNGPVRECVVMFGDSNPSGSFGVYHLWITQAIANRWASLSDLSNEAHDVTFVSGPRVIYNAAGRFAGSPYHQNFNTPTGSLCHYKLIFQDDDAFLGATSFNKIHQPGNGAGDDASLQREQLANTFLRALGVPWLNRRHVAVFVNGHRRGPFMEDAQTPDGDMVKEHYPTDKDGWLYKMQPWFEFAPTPSGSSIGFNNEAWCYLMPFTTTGGVKKTARYRYNFLARRTPFSASDYTNVFALVDAAGSRGKPGYLANVQSLADMENFMRVFAANHAAGNWDAYGCQNAQNLYGYMGALGTRYSLLMFDFNIVIGNSGSWGPGQNLFAVNGSDPNTANFYTEPTFRRMYWRALQELVSGPLDVAKSGPLLDAKYNAFVANGQTAENPTSSIKGWLTSARSSITSQIAAENATAFILDSPITVNGNSALLTGRAPFAVKTVWINGIEFPLTWNTVTAFRITVPLQPGTNLLSVVGVDRHGQPVAGASNTVAAVFSGALPSPAGSVVFNEIMNHPAVPGAQFVELYNNSPSTAFDLSGCEVSGLGYSFPPGSLIGPKSFLVLAANPTAFIGAYGAATPIFDTFHGVLPSDGGTLALIQHAVDPADDLIIAQIRYSTAAPWPAEPPGSSLQLIDPQQDNWRAGNWGVCQTNGTAPSPPWQYVSITGTAPRPILLICLHGAAGDCYLDDLCLVAGSVPEAGVNLLTNGDFEGSLTGPWTVSAKLSDSAVVSDTSHSGANSLHVVGSGYGDTISDAIWENTAPIVTNGTYTLSYWFKPGASGSQLLVRLSGTSPSSGMVYSLSDLQTTPASALSTCTPGAANSVLASLPAFPPLWLNELQADNLTGITNRAGQRAAWLELYNPTTNSVSLAGLYLANDYSDLTQWPFPANAVIGPGEFKVIFADGQTGLSTSNELHTSFTLQSRAGSLALSRLYNSLPQVLDYVDYTNLPPDWAYGSVPDGQAFTREPLFYATPGGANNGALPLSSISYTAAGSVYAQDFNSLPNPGSTSVNSANPVTINGVTYSLPNPFDFALAPASSGQGGGLGLAALAGWFGLAASGADTDTHFGASYGDQSTGGQISFGLPNSTNRALGLLATTSTGLTALGARFVNQTSNTFNHISLQFTAEVWRQSDKPKTLRFHYLVDPTGAQPFSTNYTALIPSLDVNLPVVPADVGGAPVDGTLPMNQTNLSVLNRPIADWPPGAALWLVWTMLDPTGKAQGLAIDDLTFSASASQSTNAGPALDLAGAGGSLLTLGWQSVPGATYRVQYKDDLAATAWTNLGPDLTGTGAPLSVTLDTTAAHQRFYRLLIVQ